MAEIGLIATVVPKNNGSFPIAFSEDVQYLVGTSVKQALDSLTSQQGGDSSKLEAHLSNFNNPHKVSKVQIGLDLVANAALDTSVTAGSANYISSGAVKTYVDGIVESLKSWVEDEVHTYSQEQTFASGIEFTKNELSPIRLTYDSLQELEAQAEKIPVIAGYFNGDAAKKAIGDKNGNPIDSTYVKVSQVGVSVASLEDGKIPQSQLPSYVDDVVEYASLSEFPQTGESGKIYIAIDTGKTYRWSGSQYSEISESIALGYTHSTAYYGDEGKRNADDIASLKEKFDGDSAKSAIADSSGRDISTIVGLQDVEAIAKISDDPSVQGPSVSVVKAGNSFDFVFKNIRGENGKSPSFSINADGELVVDYGE